MILSPVLYALWIYPSLPEQIPVHFDMRGTPDRYADKSLFYFIILPIANILLYYLIRYLTPLDRQKKIVDRFSFYLFRLSLAGCLSVLAWLSCNDCFFAIYYVLSSLSLAICLFSFRKNDILKKIASNIA